MALVLPCDVQVWCLSRLFGHGDPGLDLERVEIP
jgi:hypothetical protein